ncbi:tetratricopeptide repeat protein [Liquorilactobacillus sucicola]|uniref:tetratricopeptide repeat protein n=1 Tax=Liquorilactobacillus sucicola TaxID=519050 RepID=UPI001268C49B|nr:sel1 repeat family protein [Liquorilactobacillus sucicola]
MSAKLKNNFIVQEKNILKCVFTKRRLICERMKKMNRRKIFKKLNCQFQQQMNIKYAFKEKEKIKHVGFDNIREIIADLCPEYYFEMFNFEEAVKVYLNSSLKNETKEFMYLAKVVNNVRNDNLRTMEKLKKMFISNRENGSLYLQEFGNICLYCSDYEMAESIYQFQIDQGITSGFNGMGLLHKNICEYEKAEKFFIQAYRSGNQKAAYYMGCLYHELMNFEVAVQWFTNAVRENTDIDALAELGNLYLENGKENEGEQLQKIAKKLTFKDEMLTCEERTTWQKMNISERQ